MLQTQDSHEQSARRPVARTRQIEKLTCLNLLQHRFYEFLRGLPIERGPELCT